MGYSRADLRAQVEQFCQQYDFHDKVDVFYRGALAAQNPETYDEVEELTDDDKHHLRREVTHKWHLPRQFYYAVALCSLGSAVQGWDNTGANGANLSFPKGLSEPPTWAVPCELLLPDFDANNQARVRDRGQPSPRGHHQLGAHPLRSSHGMGLRPNQ